MTSLELSVAAAWNTASKDLGVVVSIPAVVNVGQYPDLTVPVLLHHFGGKAGAFVLVMGEPSESLQAVLSTVGFVSIVEARYSVYERNLFVDTLNDWGYFGPPELKPRWYTGAPWS